VETVLRVGGYKTGFLLAHLLFFCTVLIQTASRIGASVVGVRTHQSRVHRTSAGGALHGVTSFDRNHRASVLSTEALQGNKVGNFEEAGLALLIGKVRPHLLKSATREQRKDICTAAFHFNIKSKPSAYRDKNWNTIVDKGLRSVTMRERSESQIEAPLCTIQYCRFLLPS
jgi:hypothetical protein